MHVRVDRKRDKNGYITIAPRGSIDTDSHDEFRQFVEPLIAEALNGILLDLAEVDYISSAGLGVLFAFKKSLDKKGGHLLFCHPKPQISKLFETVKFLPSDRIFGSLDEADRFFYDVMNREIERQKKKR